MKPFFMRESIPQSVRAGSPVTAPRKHVLAASLIATVGTILLSFSAQTSQAGSATWLANPATDHWNNANNWTAGGPPNGPNDVATFATSNTTGIIHTADVQVSGIVFNSGASAFTITTGATATLTISGAGITDHATVAENFVTTGSSTANTIGGEILFSNNATARTAVFTNNPSTIAEADGGTTQFTGNSTAANAIMSNEASNIDQTGGGTTYFHDSATAGSALITNHGATASGFAYGGQTWFLDSSTAGNSIITNEPGTFDGEGTTDIYSSAGNATFTNNGGTSGALYGGETLIDNGNSGTATFINNGGTANGADGGATGVYNSLGNPTFIANGGTNGGGGGRIVFVEGDSGGTARVEIFGNAYFSNDVLTPAVTIGSLEGDGIVYLGGGGNIPPHVSIGGNNMSTTFSGVIHGGNTLYPEVPNYLSSIAKVGTGTLTLTNASTYSGGTTVTTGTLVAGHDGALGVGDVTVASGAILTMQNGTNNDYIFDGASLIIASSSTVNLNFTGAPDIVGNLIIDGVLQPAGLYGGPASPAPHVLPEFTGTGEILVTAPVAVSRKLHGGTPFDVALPFIGAYGIECRSGGAGNAFQILATFGETVTFSSAQVTSGTGMVASTSGNGTATVTINLTGVTDAQRLVVTLFNVNYGPATGNLPIRMAALLGDTNNNGTTNAADVAQTKGRLGQSVTNLNFRSDVNVSGTITASDVAIVKANLGHGLP
jgi:autotransporter-associated beta strand protein